MEKNGDVNDEKELRIRTFLRSRKSNACYNLILKAILNSILIRLIPFILLLFLIHKLSKCPEEYL